MTEAQEAAAPLYRYRFGACEFDESRFELTVGGLVVEIEHKPLRVLQLLLRRRGELLTREELLETVWADRVTVEQVLTSAVAKLRKALDEPDAQRIVTVPRGGYRFDGPVERVAVGTRFASSLRLAAGAAVPGREHFTLKEPLATSQGSEVWLARHAKTGETRVYKMARTPEHLSTLKREATLYRFLRLTLGERPDLLRILDWNFESFPFYLECEHGGQNLRDWAAANGRLRALSCAERIALFLTIADLVEAAHSVGVLHKDLKPTNVLVAADGTVRVSDFGSGRLLEPERLEALGITQMGLTVTQAVATDCGSGTLLYLAPELIAGDSPTVRSDVYALGLMLYQILCGDLRRPLASGWEAAIGDELLVQDIKDATQGDPALRLGSVGQLTQRLRSLEARRQERDAARRAAERAAQAERDLERARVRRPWVAAVLLVLLAGLTLSAYAMHGEQLARIEAEAAAARAETINRFLSDDLLGAADLSASGSANNPTMREILARTGARLGRRFNNDPLTKASIELALGAAYFGLTDYATAEKYRRDALALQTASLGPASTEALLTQYLLAAVLAQTGRLDAADQMVASADRLAGRRIDGPSRLALQAHLTRAALYKLRMAPAQAVREYLKADEIRAAIDPANANLLLRIHDGLGWCYVRLDRTAEAERVLSEVISPSYPPDAAGPLFWAMVRIDDGIALMSLQRYDQAQTVLQSALDELHQTVAPDHVFVGYVDNELGELYTRRRQWAAAEQVLRAAYSIFARRVGEHGQATVTVGANLGIVEYHSGRYADAIATLGHMRTLFIQTLGESSPQAQIVAYYLAAAEQDRGDPEAAARLVTGIQADKLASAEPRDDWPARLQALNGAIALKRGHKAEGLTLLKSAIAAMQARHTPSEDVEAYRRLFAGRVNEHRHPAGPQRE